MERIDYYFPGLTPRQRQQFGQLGDLYRHWNEQVNVISRQDVENLYERHVLHSLGIARVIRFRPMSELLDVGTGGGFPGVPLAILFPDCHFHLIDSIGKKIRVVQEVSTALGLGNVHAEQLRAEQAPADAYDFVLSRAVTRLTPLVGWLRGKINPNHFNDLPNGLLTLKGGELEQERRELGRPSRVYALSDFFEEPFFETKKVVYVPLSRPK